jgi:predicted dehydrogenase
MKPVNVAVLGVSGFSHHHLNNIKRLIEQKACVLKALVVINQDEVQEELTAYRNDGVKIFSSIDEMFADSSLEIEAIFNPTGIAAHCPLTKKILGAGYHVYTEKPIAATIEEAQEMIEAADATDRVSAIGYQSCSAPIFKEIRSRVHAGTYGKILRIHAHASWPRDKNYYDRNNWAGELRSGDNWVLDSPMNNALSHYLNTMIFLASAPGQPPVEIRDLQAELYRIKEIASADTCFLKFTSTDDIPFLYAVTHSGGTSIEPEIAIICENATITVYMNNHYTITHKDGKEEEYKDNVDVSLEAFKNFLSVIRGTETEVNCNFKLASIQTKLINAAHESSPIVSLPAELSKSKAMFQSELIYVEGLENIVKESAISGLLPSEMENPPAWATAGKRVDMLHYTRFNGVAE